MFSPSFTCDSGSSLSTQRLTSPAWHREPGRGQRLLQASLSRCLGARARGTDRSPRYPQRQLALCPLSVPGTQPRAGMGPGRSRTAGAASTPVSVLAETSGHGRPGVELAATVAESPSIRWAVVGWSRALGTRRARPDLHRDHARASLSESSRVRPIHNQSAGWSSRRAGDTSADTQRRGKGSALPSWGEQL